MKHIIFYILIFSSFLLGKDIKIGNIIPEIIRNDGNLIIQSWIIPNDPDIYNIVDSMSNNITSYKDILINILGNNRIENAIIFESEINLNYISETEYSDGNKKNAELIHHGEYGKIRRINIIESQLLDIQLKKYPLYSHPTEFIAYFLITPQKDSIKIYFAASDTPWVPKHPEIFENLKIDLKNGMQLINVLHNHYEKAENNFIGILAPSTSDMGMFKMMRDNFSLQTVTITNGFHTVEIKSENFNKFFDK